MSKNPLYELLTDKELTAEYQNADSEDQITAIMDEIFRRSETAGKHALEAANAATDLEKVLADDAAWFRAHGPRRKRVRLLTAAERIDFLVAGHKVEPSMNVVIVSQIEPGMRQRYVMDVAPAMLGFVLKHGDKVVEIRKEGAYHLAPLANIDGEILL